MRLPLTNGAAAGVEVGDLKRKAEDPYCDRTKRQMIEGFRLPDPQKDRDLYRLIGKGSAAKLIVLWGVEREEGSALSPGAAVDLMHTPGGENGAAAPGPKKSKLVPVLLLAALGAGGWFYHQEQEKKRLAAETAALVAQQAEEARLKAEQDRIDAFNAANAKNAAAASAPKPPAPMPSAVADAPKSTASSQTSTDSVKISTDTPKAAASGSMTSWLAVFGN